VKKRPSQKTPTAGQAAGSPQSRKKMEKYAGLARQAFRAYRCEEALEWSLKALELEPDNQEMRFLALECAILQEDEDAILALLGEIYRDGLLTVREGFFILGRLALAAQDYVLAEEVFRALLGDYHSVEPRLKGRLSKAKLKEAQQGLLYCQLVLGQTQFALKPVQAPARQRSAAAPAAAPSNKTKPARAAPVPRAADPRPDAPAPRKPKVSGKAPAPREEKPKPAKRHRAAPSPAGPGPPPPKQGRRGGRPPRAAAPAPPPPVAPPPEPLPELSIKFETDPTPVLEAVQDLRRSDPAALQLALEAYRLSFRTSYDQLLCLPTLRDVRSLWYQEETARKVMKYFRGRAILADEVGLGKTIEAGLILKEYLLRGLVRTVLVLAPSSLVHQWREELSGKFGISFASTQDELFKQDPERFWAQPFILASLQTARSKRHFPALTSRNYDLVVVDEAHHLKNRATQNWKLVNAVRKTFLLLLTATPVQNSLEELYNLVTLLRPGHLKTRKAFLAEFTTRGHPTDPRNREKLRQLLQEVMVRNTRSVTQLRLPPRSALTVRLSPGPAEADFYQGVSRLVATQASRTDLPAVAKLSFRKLLEAAGSSPAAALRMLERWQERGHNDLSERLRELLDLGRRIRRGAKARKLVELVQAAPAQKIVFVNYLASLEHLESVLAEQRIPYVTYTGALTPAQKQAALASFRDGCPVLLATGTGGEGHNLQFCHVMLNYDLPWNPMEIEQRIGRLHRIGQEKEVQVYNFCAAGSIEDHILEVLDKKINMFELVVGEMDMILGQLREEEEFGDLVYDIWVKHPEGPERRRAFEDLAVRLQQARSAYEKSKELDDKLFQEDFGV